jgi:hypothetical protein
MNDEHRKCSGTYLKVIRFPQQTNPDGFVVLYLRPANTFLMLGYWCGYERAFAAGTWDLRRSEVLLEGRGRVATDAVVGPGGRTFERTFRHIDSRNTPGLEASEELQDWSLLSWKGPLMYIGQRTIIDPDGEWLPGSMEAVDEWIRRVREV